MGIENDDLTDDERELMQQQSAGGDPEQEPATKAAAEDQKTEQPDASAEPKDEAGSDAVAAETDAEPEAFVPKFSADPLANWSEQKAAVRAEKAAAHKQWSEGEISDEDYQTRTQAADDRLEELMVAKASSDALRMANEQIERQRMQDTLRGIATDAAKIGIDYGNPALSAAYDASLAQVKSESEWQDKPFAIAAQEAHARVLKAIGYKPPAAAGNSAATPAAAAQKTKPVIPPTLGSMPAAAATPVGQDLAEQLDAITDPDELERRWAALPQSQRTSMLRSTLN